MNIESILFYQPKQVSSLKQYVVWFLISHLTLCAGADIFLLNIELYVYLQLPTAQVMVPVGLWICCNVFNCSRLRRSWKEVTNQ